MYCVLHVDNRGVFKKRIKSKVSCDFIHQYFSMEISISHVFSPRQLADYFTTAMMKSHHNVLPRKLMLKSSQQQFEGDCGDTTSGPPEIKPPRNQTTKGMK